VRSLLCRATAVRRSTVKKGSRINEGGDGEYRDSADGCASAPHADGRENAARPVDPPVDGCVDDVRRANEDAHVSSAHDDADGNASL